MTTIELVTAIEAPLQICFDLSRSAELHMISTEHTNETVVAGRNTGLFEKGDTVIWRARHFGMYQQMKIAITAIDAPSFFQDEMVHGPFSNMRHQHFFSAQDGVTIMKDNFQYKTPHGIAGKCFDILILRRYMTRLLLKRNLTIKAFAEKGRWKEILPAKY